MTDAAKTTEAERAAYATGYTAGCQEGYDAAAAEIARLNRIEVAARHVAETLNGGFIVCQRCGDQEMTTDIDYARELYAALRVEERR